MTDVADVKRALARLARREAPRSDWRPEGSGVTSPGESATFTGKPATFDGDPGAFDGDPATLDGGPAATIQEAETAIEDVERAATFATAGGRERLESAVERAEHAGKQDLFRRGRNVLTVFERFEQACRSDGRGNR